MKPLSHGYIWAIGIQRVPDMAKPLSMKTKSGKHTTVLRLDEIS